MRVDRKATRRVYAARLPRARHSRVTGTTRPARARRKAVEEITCDDEFPPELAEPCRCGAPKCRGVIVREEPSV
ncbi:MAG: hypothetical protein Q8S33_16435 [Myxococcales bacterium]|nr:hypothetical protein [Myxococcales bacterium]